MVIDSKSLNLSGFYPNELNILDVEETESSIVIRMKSVSRTTKCPKCGIETSHLHGTYQRKVQDLPILGKNVRLIITAHEYICDHDACDVSTFAETFDDFLNFYSRMTVRCADFVCTLSLETSCEGCARICKAMNIHISGDSVIRLLIKQFQNQATDYTGTIIGVDDFAFKKRHSYGTIIVDGKNHKLIAILDGRDGNTLKEWLKKNKQVKVVTRDRASAYATAIQEVLPDAMQIADRFHLHQNLLEAIRNTVNSIIPSNVKIPKETGQQEMNQDEVADKKNN